MSKKSAKLYILYNWVQYNQRSFGNKKYYFLISLTHLIMNNQNNQLSNKEEYDLKHQEKLGAQSQATRIHVLKKRIKSALLVLAVGAGIGFLIWYAATRPPVPESDIISREGIHWHPELSIYIKGQIQEIPGNAGTHTIMHTHDTTGMLHVHPANKLVLKDHITLGKFFKLWGKKFSSTCIFDNCNSSEGEVKMTVNGVENTEFENYVMQDKDKIVLRYE